MLQTTKPSPSKPTIESYCCSLKLVLWIMVTFWAISPAVTVRAQNVTDTAVLVPGHTYIFTKTNEESIKARVTSFDSNVVMASVKNTGIVIIKRSEIKSIIRAAPSVNKNFANIETGWGTGSYATFSVKVNYTVKRHVFSLGYLYGAGESPDKPEDYRYVTRSAYFSNPNRYYNVLYASLGYILPEHDFYFRPIIKGGLAIEYVKDPVFKKEYYMVTYSTTFEEQITVGVIINPVIEFPICRTLALSTGGIINISPAGNIYCIEANLLLGKIRKLDAWKLAAQAPTRPR